jgi:putative oxidoreductase
MSIAALETKIAPLFDWADVLGRIGLALLFLWSGYTKFAYMAANVMYMKTYGMPAAELLIWPAALFELIAGAMLVLGWNARWAPAQKSLWAVTDGFLSVNQSKHAHEG